MATRAFILIETAPSRIDDVVTALRGIEEVTSADAITGPYDVIAIIEAPDLNTVGDVVSSRVHRLPGVVRTITCLAT